MIYYDGYAFSSTPGQMTSKEICERYDELLAILNYDVHEHIAWEKTPKYAHTEFRGNLITETAKSLSEMDILILMDKGNLCFGGVCDKTSDGKFSGSYNTD